MRVGVTGAGGLLGRTLVPLWRAAGVDIVEWTHAALDVTDAAAVRRAVADAAPDAVVHLAAWTDVDGAEAQPEASLAVNAGGTRHVAEACAARGARCIYVSSDYVLNGDGGAPLATDAPLRPAGVYARGKAEGEAATRAAGGRWLIARTGWVYGPHGKNFVDTMAQRARGGVASAVVDDQEGAPNSTRFIASVLLQLARQDRAGLWHVATAGTASWFDVARVVYRAAGADPALVTPQSSASAARPAARPSYSVLDTSATVAALGHPLPPWERDVEAYVETGTLPASAWELN